MSSGAKGTGSDLFRSASASPSTSTSPVGILGLTLPSPRGRTRPPTETTHSLRSAAACSYRAAAAASVEPSEGRSKTICVTPSRSLREMKITPPKFRYAFTHPHSRTRLPASAARSSPQEWVLASDSSLKFSCSILVFHFSGALPRQVSTVYTNPHGPATANSDAQSEYAPVRVSRTRNSE